MHSSTASAAFTLHVLDVARQQGLDADRLAEQIGLSRAALDDPIARVPLERVRELLACCVEGSGLAHFGLLVGAAVRPATYSGLGYAAMTCATLGDAMALIRRFGKIVFDNPSSQTQFLLAGDTFMVEDKRITEIEPYSASHTEAVLAGWVAFGRWLVSDGIELTRVDIMHAPPRCIEPYQRYFRCPVHFEQPRNALHFPAAALTMRVHGADPRMHSAMLLEAEQQIDRAYAPISMKNQLRALLVERLAYGEVQLDVLSRRLGVTPRTLQRRLSREGETFSGVLEGVRIDMARRYLRNSTLSIQDIGFMIGFAHASAFSHAFRNAYGMSPQDFRKGSAANDVQALARQSNI